MAAALTSGIAFVKIYLVGWYFMELRFAPRALRLICSGWVVIARTATLVLVLT